MPGGGYISVLFTNKEIDQIESYLREIEMGRRLVDCNLVLVENFIIFIRIFISE